MRYEKDLSTRRIAENVAFKIRTAKSFTDAKRAEECVRKIVRWLWDAKDYGAINEFYFEELYGMCIDALVEIDKRL